MSAITVTPPFPVFSDIAGAPLQSGLVYVGTAGLNAEANQIPVFWDSDLTIPAAQPLRTINGYISRNGSPAQVYADAVDYSLLVKSKTNALIWSSLKASGISSNSEGIVFLPAGTGAVATTVQSKLRERVSIADFGASPSLADNTSAIQAAIDHVGSTGGGDVWVLGIYKTNPLIIRHPNVRLIGDGKESKLISLSSFTTLHNPTVWIARSNCAVVGIEFTYDGWDSSNLTSLKTTRPVGNSYYGCHIASGYTELYTSANSGIFNTFRGVTLEVVDRPLIENVSIIGTAVHGVSLLNTTNATVKNNKVSEFKGTGIYGFIAPGATVSGNSLDTSGDDGVYFGCTDSHLNGVWTPITKAQLTGLAYFDNKVKKIGAKAFAASGYDGVMVYGNRADDTRSVFMFFADEPSQGASACTNVDIYDNHGTNIFGGFGTVGDGYYYSTDIVTAAGGIYSAITLDKVSGFKVHSNYVKKSAKVTSSAYRGYFGTQNLYNGSAFDNTFIDFQRNNIGAESAIAPITSNIDFFDNVIDSSVTTFTRLLYVGVNSRAVRIRKNKFKSLAAQSVNTWSAIWAAPGSQFVEDRNEFDLPNGLDRMVTIEVPNSVESLGNDSGSVDLGSAFAASRKIRWSTAAPTVGTWVRGDIVFNISPSASGAPGWVCVTSGAPGTWKSMANLAA